MGRVRRETVYSYFNNYATIQAHKHALLKYYLGAWYPKLSSWSGRVLYLETHAGRGVHKGGQLGSPLVAMRTLWEHRQRDYLLPKCEFHFYLMELDENNASILREQVANEPQHPKIKVHVEQCDFAQKFREELDRIEASGKHMVPALVFIDPFGYKIPVDLVKRVLRFQSCEVMVNFMAQPVARAVRDATKRENLNLLFGSDIWRRAQNTTCFESQMQQLIAIYSEAVGARWTTKLRLTGQTDYTLMHFTNHHEGRVTMKRSIWAITGQYGRPGDHQLLMRDNPDQGLLITQDPDLSPLALALQEAFLGKEFTREEALEWLLDQDYLDTHLHKVFADGRREGWLTTTHRGPFGPSMNGVKMKIESVTLL